MPRRRIDDVIVGLTVLVTAIALTASVLWVGEARSRRGQSQMEARFRDVGNTRVGDALVVRGVRAGQVEAIELEPGGWVRVRFAFDADVPLPADPVVLVGMSTLLGERQATVMDRSALPASPQVQEAIREASGERGVMPGATLPDLEQLTVAAGRIAGDVALLAERASLAFDDTAALQLRGTFRSLGAMSGELERTVRTQSRQLDGLTSELRTGLASVTQAAAALERTMARADAATADGALESGLADARAVAAQLRAATASLQTTAERLGESQVDVARLVLRVDSLAARMNASQGTFGRILDDPALYANGDSLLVELRALVADVRANPGKYVSLRIF